MGWWFLFKDIPANSKVHFEEAFWYHDSFTMKNIEVIQYLENQSKNNLFGSLRFAYIMKFVLLLLLEKIVQSMKKKPANFW